MLLAGLTGRQAFSSFSPSRFISSAAGTPCLAGAYSDRSSHARAGCESPHAVVKVPMQNTFLESGREPAIRLISDERELSETLDAREEPRAMAIVEEVVSVTQHPCSPEVLYAPAAVRDRFLASLDAGDWNTSIDMAANLTGCGNPLPTSTCSELGLPTGSTYGAAAKCVLAVDARGRSNRC